MTVMNGIIFFSFFFILSYDASGYKFRANTSTQAKNVWNSIHTSRIFINPEVQPLCYMIALLFFNKRVGGRDEWRAMMLTRLTRIEVVGYNTNTCQYFSRFLFLAFLFFFWELVLIRLVWI